MPDNNNGNNMSLKGIFQGMIPADAELMQGTVIAVGPLKIQMTNDEKLIINERITVVPRHLSDYTTECTVYWRTENTSGGSGDASFSSHSHAISGRKGIVIHNALKVGDAVYVLSLNNGKLYYVLDRVVA